MKALYAGPWIGEFGHEIMVWQAYLRGIAKNYDYIVICGPKGHFGMYSDFADRYIEFECDPAHANMWMNDTIEVQAIKYFEEAVGMDENILNAEWVTPRSLWSQYTGIDKSSLIISIGPREFKKYDGKGIGYDILYHARDRMDWDSGFRNWSSADCARLLDLFHGKRIGCVGLSKSAHHLIGTDDLRGLPLAQLTSIMSHSGVFVGPVSGPCHLATLCGLPQATWATKAEHTQRVKDKWNPFGTKTEVITADDAVWKNRTPYTPPVNEIEKNIRRLLDVEVSLPV